MSIIWTRYIQNMPWRSRWRLFSQKQAEAERLPWTRGSLRVHCQAMMLKNDIVPNPVLPSETNYGWKVKWWWIFSHPNWVVPCPDAVVQLIKCSCKTSKYTSNCSCKRNNFTCTKMCQCGANEYFCQSSNCSLHEVILDGWMIKCGPLSNDFIEIYH